MKKIFRVFFVLAFAALLTGICSGKEVCASSEEEITLDASRTKYIARAKNGLVYTWSKDGADDCKITLIGYEGSDENVVIPTRYNNHPVWYIADRAFADNKIIRSVTISDAVDYIGTEAFKNCTNLAEVKLAGDHIAFYRLISPNATHGVIRIEDHVFEGCSALKSIDWEYGWKQYGNKGEVFYGSGIEKISVPIATWCYLTHQFNNCPNLETIDLHFGYNGSSEAFNLKYFEGVPKLKTINIYNPEYCYSFDASLKKNSKGEYINPGLFTELTSLEAINIYVNEVGANTQLNIPNADDWVSSNKAVAYFYDKTFGKILIVGEGTATLTSKDAGFIINVYVGKGDDNSIKLEDCEIELPVDKFTFYGEAVSPLVYVTYGKELLQNGTDYRLKYENNKAIGTASVTVEGIGKYSGSVKKSFTLIPFTTVIETVKKGSGSYTVTWNKNPNATGYELAYSKKKSGSYKKLTAKDLTLSSKKLKSGMFIKIRTYTEVNGKKYYSVYSDPIKLK